jgi:hypothetical protein
MKSVSFGELLENKTEKTPHQSPINIVQTSPVPPIRFGSEAGGGGSVSLKYRSSTQSVGNIFYRNQNSLDDDTEDVTE